MNREQHIELTRPFTADQIKWRVGSRTKDKKSGMVLAYIDARDLQNRLDQVLGFANWKVEYTGMPNGTDIAMISIRIDGEWVGKSDGAGFTNMEAEKGGLSDAFKRAGVVWGVARYLYSLPSQWIDLQNGYMPRGFVGTLPQWAMPDGWERVYPRMFGEVV